MLEAGAGKAGEFYLTDAFQYMVDRGARLQTAPVTGWYDCGKVETLLDTNRHLLETGRGNVHEGAEVDGVEIDGPVRIEAGAVVRGGRIGPNVTIERGAVVEGCVLSNTIVGHDASVSNSQLSASLVGARARVSGVNGAVNLADDSVVEG